VSDPYTRLDEAMRLRRLTLGMKTWRELAQAAGISYETLRALRNGEGRPADATVHGLERALQWEAGSIEGILAGGDPRPAGTLPPFTAEMHGAVARPEEEAGEEDSPITPQLRALLEQAQKQTREQLADLAAKVDEQSELIRKLLEDRRGA
jgi:hypothetical protein